jgi:hypothetical protein
VIADFEPPTAGSISPANATAQTASDDAPQGQRYLRLTAATTQPGRAYVRLPVPKDIDFTRPDRLTAQVRAPQGDEKVELRWLALGEKGRPIFQRRFMLTPGEKWVKLDEPLRDWRWDSRFIGDWREVREIVLRIESGTRSVEVDDIRVAGEAQPDARVKWLLELAFEGRPTKHLLEDNLLVATDAVEAFGDSELSRLLQDMKNVRAFVRRAFANVLKPTESGGPLALLIFKDNAAHRRFFDRLGERYRAEIAPPSAQGYTIQDMATSTYRAELGPRRPVYVHESTHAIIARDLRLQVGYAPHTPLHEGIANYVQVCVHPQSVSRRTYVDNFAGPIDRGGGGLFVPLRQLFEMRVTTREYAQLASVMAYLLENDPQLLDGLIQGIADGQTASSVIEMSNKTWPQLQESWQAWGRKRFAAGGNENGAVFDPPVEFRQGPF